MDISGSVIEMPEKEAREKFLEYEHAVAERQDEYATRRNTTVHRAFGRREGAVETGTFHAMVPLIPPAFLPKRALTNYLTELERSVLYRRFE